MKLVFSQMLYRSVYVLEVAEDDSFESVLWTKDIKELEMILPPIGTRKDLICAESESCLVTNMFTEYVDVINKLCAHNGREKWTAADIKILRWDMQQFKVNGLAVLKACKNQNRKS